MSTHPKPSQPESLMVLVGALAGAVASAVGFVYIVGGAVMWLRFWRSGLPADQAVALVPPTELMVVGMRVMIIPAVAAALLFLILAAKSSGRLPERRRLTRGLLIVPAGLTLVVPLTPGAFAWPLAAVAIWLVWRKLIDPARDEQETRRALVTAALAAALASAFVSIARQFDHPVRLPGATVVQKGTPGSTTGVLIYAGPDSVVIGLPEAHGLTSYRRASVTSIVVGPSLDQRPPEPSLLSRALGPNAWAATPLELWCGGESYGWNRLDDLCQSQPRIVRSATYKRKTGALTVNVRCPKEAVDGCSGYLTLTTREKFVVDKQSIRANIKLGSKFFRLDAEAEVPVVLDVYPELDRCLRQAKESPVPLSAVLSSDLAAEARLNGEGGQTVPVEFGKRRSGPLGHCDAMPKAPEANTPAHRNDSGAGRGEREGSRRGDDKKSGEARDGDPNLRDGDGSRENERSRERDTDAAHGSLDTRNGSRNAPRSRSASSERGSSDGSSGEPADIATPTPEATPTPPATPPKPDDPLVIPKTDAGGE